MDALKGTFTGIIKTKLLNAGTKSEHEGFVLDTGHGPARELKVKGLNPFRDPALEPYVGKRVSVKGTQGSGRAVIFVDNLSDISVLPPPAKQLRPSRP